MTDLSHFLAQHDRVRQLLLDGADEPELDEHVAACVVCRALAVRLGEVDRLIRDVPEPRPALLDEILQGGAGVSEPEGRIELLWPTSTGASPSSTAALQPLVLVVEADPCGSGAGHLGRAEHVVIVGRHPITIGRGPDLDVSVWDRSVSRRHAQLDWRDESWVIRDLESTNGTRVNDARLGTAEVVRLQPGDLIEMGHCTRLLVRDLLAASGLSGVVAEMQRFLAMPARPPGAFSGVASGEELCARIVGLREETVRLREELSVMARSGVDAETLPLVYEKVANFVALLEGSHTASVTREPSA